MNNRTNSYSNRPGSTHSAQNTQNAAIDKYRSILNLPARSSLNNKKAPLRYRGVQISEQTAKLIALSIKGLLNS